MNKASWCMLLMGLTQLSCSDNATDEGASSSLLSDAKTIATMGRRISATGLDCGSFKSYTAALATHTVDCLGTIRPDSFSVNAENILERNFTSCPLDAKQLTNIDSLLLLQRREARMPHVKECMAGAYADYVRGFAETGVTECPGWRKEQTLNAITAGTVEGVLPKLAEMQAASKPTMEFPGDLEVNNVYRTSFKSHGATATPDSAIAGKACALAFTGFVLQADRDSVITDPVAWLLDTTYSSADADPYLRSGAYYHPMSWYGGVPGVQYGHVNRFRPCPDCPPERCSYYTGVHKLTRLQLDCIVESDWDTCNSYCGPLRN